MSDDAITPSLPTPGVRVDGDTEEMTVAQNEYTPVHLGIGRESGPDLTDPAQLAEAKRAHDAMLEPGFAISEVTLAGKPRGAEAVTEVWVVIQCDGCDSDREEIEVYSSEELANAHLHGYCTAVRKVTIDAAVARNAERAAKRSPYGR